MRKQFTDRFFHERFDRDDAVKMSSNRSFGVVFAVCFALFGIIKLRHGNSLGGAWLILAMGFLAVAVFKPALIAPFNRLWTHLGLLLAKIMNPLFLGLIYYSTIVPIGLYIRFTGRDSLRLKFDATIESYWIPRTPPGPEPETMRNQF